MLQEFSKALPKMDTYEQTKAIIQWICRNFSFGTLDITMQRAAMVIE